MVSLQQLLWFGIIISIFAVVGINGFYGNTNILTQIALFFLWVTVAAVLVCAFFTAYGKPATWLSGVLQSYGMKQPEADRSAFFLNYFLLGATLFVLSYVFRSDNWTSSALMTFGAFLMSASFLGVNVSDFIRTKR